MYELELSNNFSVLNQQNSHMSSPDNTTLNPILTSSPISDIKAHVPPPASNTHPNSSKSKLAVTTAPIARALAILAMIYQLKAKI